jgi:hypothetical protein
MVDLIRRFPTTQNATMDSFLTDQVRLLVSSSGSVPGLVQVTPPMSSQAKGTAAKKVGEKAVSRDIAQVYVNAGEAWAVLKSLGQDGAAAAFWKAYKARHFTRCNQIIDLIPGVAAHFRLRPFDGGAAHEARRGSNGRVNGRTPSLTVHDPATLKRYVRRKQKNVGLLASALPTAVGSRYGPLKGIPAWVKRHSASWGYVRDKRESKGRTITLGISKKGVRDMQRRFTYVLNYRMKALKRQLPHLVRKLEARLQEQLNGA